MAMPLILYIYYANTTELHSYIFELCRPCLYEPIIKLCDSTYMGDCMIVNITTINDVFCFFCQLPITSLYTSQNKNLCHYLPYNLKSIHSHLLFMSYVFRYIIKFYIQNA